MISLNCIQQPEGQFLACRPRGLKASKNVSHLHRYGRPCMPCPAAQQDESEQGCSLVTKCGTTTPSFHGAAQACRQLSVCQYVQLST